MGRSVVARPTNIRVEVGPRQTRAQYVARYTKRHASERGKNSVTSSSVNARLLHDDIEHSLSI